MQEDADAMKAIDTTVAQQQANELEGGIRAMRLSLAARESSEAGKIKEKHLPEALRIYKRSRGLAYQYFRQKYPDLWRNKTYRAGLKTAYYPYVPDDEIMIAIDMYADHLHRKEKQTV